MSRAKHFNGKIENVHILFAFSLSLSLSPLNFPALHIRIRGNKSQNFRSQISDNIPSIVLFLSDIAFADDGGRGGGRYAREKGPGECDFLSDGRAAGGKEALSKLGSLFSVRSERGKERMRGRREGEINLKKSLFSPRGKGEEDETKWGTKYVCVRMRMVM